MLCGDSNGLGVAEALMSMRGPPWNKSNVRARRICEWFARYFGKISSQAPLNRVESASGLSSCISGLLLLPPSPRYAAGIRGVAPSQSQ